MEEEVKVVGPSGFHAKATFRLTSEVHSVDKSNGTLSELLIAVKEESMCILKDFITRHNVSIDVPDELVDGSEDADDDVVSEKPPKKQK